MGPGTPPVGFFTWCVKITSAFRAVAAPHPYLANITSTKHTHTATTIPMANRSSPLVTGSLPDVQIGRAWLANHPSGRDAFNTNATISAQPATRKGIVHVGSPSSVASTTPPNIAIPRQVSHQRNRGISRIRQFYTLPVFASHFWTYVVNRSRHQTHRSIRLCPPGNQLPRPQPTHRKMRFPWLRLRQKSPQPGCPLLLPILYTRSLSR